ncbi:ABC amino acid transporter [Pseudomonas aeruginosa]|nr:ABC amino acid transporter [Pseudomonas aeruginosa]
MNTATASIAATTWCASRCARTTTVSSCSSAARVDYALAYRNTARQLFSEHPELEGQFQPVATVHRPELYLSFSRRHPQAEHLLERFDLGMQRILASGEYQKILDGWSQAADATP